MTKKKLKNNEYYRTLKREKLRIPVELPELSGLTRIRYEAELATLELPARFQRASDTQRATLRMKREAKEKLIEKELSIIVRLSRLAAPKDAELVVSRSSLLLSKIIKETGFVSLKQKLSDLREITSYLYSLIGRMTTPEQTGVSQGTTETHGQTLRLESNDNS